MLARIQRLVPALDDNDGNGNPGAVISSIGYICALTGYIFTILATPGITWPLFIVFTAANLAWFVCYALLTSQQSGNYSIGRIHLVMAGMAVATIGIDALIFAGLSLDWLLAIVTIAVYLMVYPTRPSLVVGIGIALVTMAMLAAVYVVRGGTFSELFQNEVTLTPAFLFTITFALFLRHQRRQREQAEALVAELETAQAQLRAHADQVEELAITQERNRMAREIHDTLGHYLTILAVQLETALKLEEHHDPRLHHELAEARRAAAECLAEVRQSVSALRPTDLTRSTLTEALMRLLREFEAALPETELVLDAAEEINTLAPELRVTLYRCTQEALTNVRKHAQATKVLVRLRVDVARGHVELTILDNGSHIPADTGNAEQAPSGFGLQGMRERIALVGGEVTAGPEPAAGWRVEMWLPMAAHAASPEILAVGGAVTAATVATTGADV